MEVTELKIRIMQKKNSLKKLNSQIDMAEERVNELKDRAMEMTKNEK